MSLAATNSSPTYLDISDNIKLAYHKISGKSPGVVYCSGFMSDMTGTKALAVEAFCHNQGRACLRFDYRGHGLSSGNLAQGTIGAWHEDALAMLDHLTEGPQILVGSSMGGWIALLAALSRPNRVKGLLGIATAADFTEELLWEKLPPEHKESLLREKIIQIPCNDESTPYLFNLDLIKEARQHLLLRSEIPLDIPVRLLHGMQDIDVPWEYSLRLTENLHTDNVRLSLIKDGNHRLMREQDLLLITNTLSELMALV